MVRKIKKAILTGGGRATRLRPVTSTINKHLLPLANKPMIFHAIEKVVKAGIEEIFINVNPGETELQKHIGDGGHWGIKITFYEQTGGPQGIAHAVKQAEKFIGDDPFLFYLSDNILLGDIGEMINEFNLKNYDCMLAFAKVPNANNFGVPIFDKNNQVVDVVEKPENPLTDLAVTGVYLYGGKVFFEAFKNIKKSARGEYEISDIHSHFLKNNYQVGYQEITGWWKDTGQPDDLISANNLILDNMAESAFKIEGQVEPGAQITGKVHIGIGTKVKGNVKIIGPAIIGENCSLENCFIKPGTTIGAGCIVREAEISESIILNNCRIECPVKLNKSIVGDRVVIKRHDNNLHRLILGGQTIIEL